MQFRDVLGGSTRWNDDAFTLFFLSLELLLLIYVLTQTMINKGKQLDAVKFIQALNLAHKHPLLPAQGRQSCFSDGAKEPTLLGALQEFIKEDKLQLDLKIRR